MSVFNELGTTSPRRWRRFAATVGMSLALVVATGAPAHATTIGVLSDDFEAADTRTVWKASITAYIQGDPNAHSGWIEGFLLPPSTIPMQPTAWGGRFTCRPC